MTAHDFPALEQFGYQQQLKRSLGLTALVVYGLVFISPTSPISIFGLVFNLSHGMVPLVYIVGFVAMGFTAFSYVMMSRAFPIAGSVYAYAARAIGPGAGFLAGWACCSITCSCPRSSTYCAPLRSRRSFPAFHAG